MNAGRASDEVSLEALLQSGRALPRAVAAARARVLARARMTAAMAPLSPMPDLAPRTGLSSPLVAKLGAATIAAGIAGGVYALNGAGPDPAHVTAPQTPSAPSAQPARVVTEAPAPAAPPVVSVQPEPRRVPRTKPATKREQPAEFTNESYAAELALLRSAHTAYAAHDFADALVLVGEHAQRFQNGALAEQREALRVRSLLGVKRTGEARRAAAAFAKRFPRSVLLHRLEAEVGASQD